MLKIIFLAIAIYLLFMILKKRKTKKPVRELDLSKEISNWRYDGKKGIKQEPLYSSRHESTPNREKAAEEIVTKHEKIIREAMKNEELE